MVQKLKYAPSLLALGVALVAGQAHAQDTNGGLQDIIVTAEKRSTNVQDVPLSITAISSEELLRQNVIGTRGLAGLAPNVNIGQDARGIIISVRGISSQGVTFSRDPSIAFHVDGVYQPRPTGASGTFFDLDRVEILRGPQGTLYGRNATGGSVNVITAKPTFEMGGYANAAYGNYNAVNVQGAFNAPIIDDKLAFRIAATHSSHDPYAPNTASATPGMDDQDDTAVRAHILFQPTDRLKVLLTGDYQWQKGHGTLIASFSKPARAVSNNTPGYQDNRLYGALAEVTYSLDAFEIVSLTSVRRDNQLWYFDSDETADPTAAGSVSVKIANSGKQFSQEVRLVSTGDGPAKWIVGGNYFREINGDEGTALYDLAFTTGLRQIRSGRRTVAKSVFGQFDYTLFDKLTLTGGLRYTKDSKEAPNGINQAFNASGYIGTNTYVAPVPYSGDKFTWRLGAKWDVGAQSNVYASVVTGYKAGGVNTPPFLNYAPETLTAYEVGTKNRLLDNTLQLNAAAFYYDYKDYQVNSATIIGGVIRSVFSNAGAATVKGVEVESIYQPTQALRIDASIGLLDTKFDNLQNAYDGVTKTRVDLTGNRLPRAPKFTWRLGARYDIQMNSGVLTPSVTVNGQSGVFFTEFNDRIFTVGTTTNDRYVALQQKGWTMVAANLRYEIEGGKWYVEAFGQNLANKTVLVSGALNTSNMPSGSYAPPRTYGIRLGVKY